jgi:hypothetical protein
MARHKGTGSASLPFEVILERNKQKFWIAPGDFLL